MVTHRLLGDAAALLGWSARIPVSHCWRQGPASSGPITGVV